MSRLSMGPKKDALPLVIELTTLAWAGSKESALKQATPYVPLPDQPDHEAPHISAMLGSGRGLPSHTHSTRSCYRNWGIWPILLCKSICFVTYAKQKGKNLAPPTFKGKLKLVTVLPGCPLGDYPPELLIASFIMTKQEFGTIKYVNDAQHGCVGRAQAQRHWGLSEFQCTLALPTTAPPPPTAASRRHLAGAYRHHCRTGHGQACSPLRIEGRLAKGEGGEVVAHIKLGGLRSPSEQRDINNVPAER